MVCSLLFVVLRCLLFVDGCRSLCVVVVARCLLLFVTALALFVVRCVLRVACSFSLFVVWCGGFVVRSRCSLFMVC